MTAQQLDLGVAREERDAALARVRRNGGTFADEVGAVIRTMDRREATGEDIRLACEERGVEPHHPNAWGAAINTWVQAGILRRTGEWRPMRTVRSHARQTPVYRVEVRGG